MPAIRVRIVGSHRPDGWGCDLFLSADSRVQGELKHVDGGRMDRLVAVDFQAGSDAFRVLLSALADVPTADEGNRPANHLAVVCYDADGTQIWIIDSPTACAADETLMRVWAIVLPIQKAAEVASGISGH